jgi:hypothetical protein
MYLSGKKYQMLMFLNSFFFISIDPGKERRFSLSSIHTFNGLFLLTYHVFILYAVVGSHHILWCRL